MKKIISIMILIIMGLIMVSFVYGGTGACCTNADCPPPGKSKLVHCVSQKSPCNVATRTGIGFCYSKSTLSCGLCEADELCFEPRGQCLKECGINGDCEDYEQCYDSTVCIETCPEGQTECDEFVVDETGLFPGGCEDIGDIEDSCEFNVVLFLDNLGETGGGGAIPEFNWIGTIVIIAIASIGMLLIQKKKK